MLPVTAPVKPPTKPVVAVTSVPVIAWADEPPITAPLIVPPVAVIDAVVIGPEKPAVPVTVPVMVDVPVTAKLPPTVTLSAAEPS